MTAELEELDKKEEKVEEKAEEDEKLQVETPESPTKNGSNDVKKSDDEVVELEEQKEVGEIADNQDKTDNDEDGEVAVVAPRRRVPRFWERFFKRSSHKRQDPAEDAEDAGTELLSKEEQKIEIKAEDEENGKVDKNDSGNDAVTLAITDENDITTDAAGDASNGKTKSDDKNGKPAGVKQPNPYLRRIGIGVLIIVVILIVVAIISVLTSSADRARGPMVEPLVITDCGPLRGFIQDDVYVFKGVPYALPPTGEHRWMPPRAAATLDDCWTDTYEAINASASCFQKPSGGIELETMSEDCLYLDVITPSLSPPKPRPVVVYIPGDYPLQGFKQTDLQWRPTAMLADEKDVTFVTVKYRVGVLGFLSLDVLTNNVRPPTSGNYGIMDVLAALKWVQRNIRAFGGDPEKVTVLAHGGGATMGLALLASKKSETLFNQMWLTAPAAHFSNKTLEQVSKDNAGFLKKLDCDSVECIYNKTAEEIVQATPSFWDSDWSIDLPSAEEEQSPVMAVVDGSVLQDTPTNLWQSGDLNQVPIVLGAATQESGSSKLLPNLASWSWTDFTDYVSEKLGPISTNLTVSAVEFYVRNSSTPLQQFHSMVSDVRTICPLEQLSQSIKEGLDQDVYWYLVDYIPSSPVQFSNDSASVELSIHGLDIAAIFGLLGRYISPMQASDITFQKNIQDLFYNFVSKGTPMIRQEVLMPSGFVNIIGNHIQSQLTPYENCHVWDNDLMYPTYAKIK